MIEVIGDSGGESQVQTMSLTMEDPDFDLLVTPASALIKAGDTVAATVSVAPMNGFAGEVSLTASGFGSGSTSTFSPAVLSGESDSQLQVTTPLTMTPGTYVLAVTGTSGSLTHTAEMTVVVTDIPTFAVSTTTQSHFLLKGYSTTIAVSVAALNGFTGRVDLGLRACRREFKRRCSRPMSRRAAALH